MSCERQWQRAGARATTIATARVKRRLLGRLDEPGAQREDRDLRAPLEERHLAQPERAREMLELGRDGLLVGAELLRDLVVGGRRQPVAVAEQRPAQLGEARLTVEKLELPPERSGGRILGEGPDMVPELVRLLQNEAKVL